MVEHLHNPAAPIFRTKPSPLAATSWPLQLAVFVVAFALIVSRRPDCLFNAQFYAEDGAVWYSQAYNMGALPALLTPYNGYLHFFPRLIAGFATLVRLDLLYVPLFLNIVAIATKILPITFLLSDRFPFSWRAKLLISFLYIALPGAWEVHANISNAYTLLALLSFMVLIAQPPRSRWGYAFDFAVLAIGGLTGPFSIFLVPVGFGCWFYRRSRASLVNLGLLLATAFAQAIFIVQSRALPPPAARIDAIIPTPDQLFLVLQNQIWFTGILGIRITRDLASFFPPIIWQWLALLTGLLGLAVFFYLLWRGPRYLKFLLYFAGILILASMWSLISRMGVSWDIMSAPGAGGRYYFIPHIAYVVSLVYLASLRAIKPLQLLGRALLCLMVVGILVDWLIPPFPNYDYGAQVETFKALPAGSEFAFQIPPEGWFFNLVKR